ncbi:MAG TPA: hypothetical protein VN456_06280, partial [Desulfosporosinus sp.]|nr:hypothetical protein [Desulfosporosinus sp.]
QAQGALFCQATPSVLHSLAPEERFLLSGSISGAAVQTCADGSRPRQRATGSHSYIPEVWRRSRTVQLVSGVTC